MGRSKQASPKRRKVDEQDDHSNVGPQPPQPPVAEGGASYSSLGALLSASDSKVNKEQQEAIATLLAAPQDAVEFAAAEATRTLIETWPQLDDLLLPITTATSKSNSTATSATPESSRTSSATSQEQQQALPSCLQGLAKCTLNDEDFEVLLDFHQTIQKRAKEWVSWSGSPTDPRRRVFGFLPNSFLGLPTAGTSSTCTRKSHDSSNNNAKSKEGEKILVSESSSSSSSGWNWKEKLDVTMPLQQPTQSEENNQQLEMVHQKQQEAPEEERRRNARAMVSLGEDCDGDHWLLQSNKDDTSKKQEIQALWSREDKLKQAIQNILCLFRPHAPPHIRPYLSLPYLVAAQPNLHCGRHLLPAHVDHPLKDGFGICIVTIAIRGDAQIFLEESTISSSSSSSSTRGVITIDQGQAYLLSGPVRNQCSHGVLAQKDCGDRESLNLRFGLHGVVLPSSPSNDANNGNSVVSVVSADEVLRHW